MHEMPAARVEHGPVSVEAAMETARRVLKEHRQMREEIRNFLEDAPDKKAAEKTIQESLWPPYQEHGQAVEQASRDLKAAIKAFYEAEAVKDPDLALAEGEYDLTMTFQNREGEERTLVDAARLYRENDRGTLLQNARSKISMTGLHNFGKQVGWDLPTAVAFVLKSKQHPDAPAVASTCWVDDNGHIFSTK